MLDNVRNHQESWPFLEPVDLNEVTDYASIVKEPMDLSTIRERLRSGFYRSKDIFIANNGVTTQSAKATCTSQKEPPAWKDRGEEERGEERVENDLRP